MPEISGKTWAGGREPGEGRGRDEPSGGPGQDLIHGGAGGGALEQKWQSGVLLRPGWPVSGLRGEGVNGWQGSWNHQQLPTHSAGKGSGGLEASTMGVPSPESLRQSLLCCRSGAVIWIS